MNIFIDFYFYAILRMSTICPEFSFIQPSKKCYLEMDI